MCIVDDLPIAATVTCRLSILLELNATKHMQTLLYSARMQQISARYDCFMCRNNKLFHLNCNYVADNNSVVLHHDQLRYNHDDKNTATFCNKFHSHRHNNCEPKPVAPLRGHSFITYVRTEGG